MSSHQMWYKLRNELKWRELQVPSTFMTVGELRGLIIEHLGLPDGETVVLYPEEDLAYESAYPDVKQFPRGSRFRATRTTVEQLAKEEEQRAGQPQVEANEPGEGKKDDRGDKSESEESEFGPDPWDRDAADRWKEKERRTGKQQTTTARNTAVDLGEVVTPAPSKASPAHIPDSQELPALTYPHQSRELTQHEWEEKLKPRRKAEVDSTEAAGMAPSGPGEPDVDEAKPTSTALVPAETRAMPASAPGKPSLLQQYPEIQYRCRSFLPQAPVELLYEVFSIGRAMNREAWDKWRAENADRNPPQDPAPDKPEEGRTHLRRSQSRRHSRSPNRHDSRDRSRTRSYGRSPARSPAHAPRRQNYHAHRSYDADRWRDSDRGTPTGHGPDSRDRRAPSRNGDYHAPRPPSRGAKSSSRSPRSPAPRRGRAADASGSSGGRRSRGARSARPTSPSPSPQPRAPPRRRNFDTQLPPQPPATRPAGQATARGSRLATFTPPPARTHAAPSDPARRRGQAAPAKSRASPRKAGDKRSRSRSQNRSVKAAGGRNGERRRASQRADRSRSRSSSSSSSGSDSSRSRSGTSSSSSTSSSSQSRSRSRSPHTQPRRRPEANERGGQRGGSKVSGVRGHQGEIRDAGERAGPQDQRGRSRRSPAKAGRDRDESPDTVKRNKKRMKGSQKKVIHVSAPKPSPKSSKDRSALFAKAVQGLRR